MCIRESISTCSQVHSPIPALMVGDGLIPSYQQGRYSFTISVDEQSRGCPVRAKRWGCLVPYFRAGAKGNG